MTAPRNILVATDFSSHGERAVEAAVELAKLFGAKLHVTHVYSLPIPLVAPYEITVPDPYLAETRRAAAAKLEQAAATGIAAGLEVESHLAEGPAAAAIAELAAKLGADLLVIGTRGHTGFKHILLGSTAGHVLRLAPCNVLTVKE